MYRLVSSSVAPQVLRTAGHVRASSLASSSPLSSSLSILYGGLPSSSTSTGTSSSSSFMSQQRRSYHQNIIDHYENPRNVGALDKGSKQVGTGLVGAPACGDVMKLQIKVGADGKIEDAKFKTFGCGSAIASSSVATEWVKGRSLEECLTIKNTDIAAHLKLPPVKLHCSMLAEDAIKAAVKDYMTKQGSTTTSSTTTSVAQ